jgi:hypothetical protein
MNAQFGATVGRHYCVGPKGSEREKYRSAVVLERRNKGLFWTIFEDRRRDEAKLLNCFRMSVDFFFDELCEGI